MAYTALEKMRRFNADKYGCDVGPMQPALCDGASDGYDLKSAALRFLHERCENLRFDMQIEEEEARTGCWRGTSRGPGQIPYNMQMDINRLCLERELERFINSGATQDAFNVYYCFLEIFLGSYGKSNRMVELLSEYEANGSSLLMKHRDHYSHSVYVFALGLAIYETNDNFRRAFNTFYHFDAQGDDPEQNHAAANFFLKYWGLTSLFHDIGYPFELTFEQVMAYFRADDETRGRNNPYVVYRNMESMTKLSPRARERFEQIYDRRFDSVEALLAHDVTQKLGATYGFTEDYLAGLLKKKTSSPEDFAYYMDHAFFSALRLYHELMDAMGIDEDDGGARSEALQSAHVDALSAILLHYVVYRYSIAFCDEGTKPRLTMDMFPLAWLLILCDELQCWDRTAYGRDSRTELAPMGVEFDFDNNRLIARYLYDEEEQDKIDDYLWKFVAWKQAGKPGKAPELKAYSDMADENKSFVRDIEMLVDTTGIPLTVVCDIAPVNRGVKHVYLSDSSFLHLYDFAMALNARYAFEGHEDEVDSATLEKAFAAMSLEYKLSNINQVKSFSRYLNAIHCFYTDRPVDYDMLSAFTPEQIRIIAPMEHERWVRERQAMGWRYGDLYERIPAPDGVDENAWRKMLREQMRCHKHAMDGELTKERILRRVDELSSDGKNKDRMPFNSMLKLIKKFDGLRIYRFSGRTDQEDIAY